MSAKPRRRIVIISATYPPVVGGAEIDSQRLASELMRRGHGVVVLCMGGPPMPPLGHWTDEAGVPIRVLTDSRESAAANAVFAARVAHELWKERRRCDIAFFSMFGMYVASGLPAARALGQAIVLKVHGSSIVTAVRKSRLGALELDWLGRWAGKVILLNEGMVEEALAAGLPRHKLLHLPNPIDTARFAPPSSAERYRLRESRGIPQGAKVLAYTGRLSREKGLSWLLDAFAAVAREMPEALLVLVGAGPEREALEAQTRRLGLDPDRVRFVGGVSPSEIPSWLAVADAFALLSPHEGFSCALAEAMAAGLPAIVSAIPANLQLIDDGVEGYTVPAGDIGAAAAAIRRALADSEASSRMGGAGRRKVVENYSLAQIVDAYEDLFEEALAAKRR